MLRPALLAATLLALAACASPKAACPEAVSVTLHAKGRVTVDGQSVAQDEIATAINARCGKREKAVCRVTITGDTADKDVIYRDVMIVMDALQKANCTVALVAEEVVAD